MTTEQVQIGGFMGDLAQAFTPPSAGGCCGGPAATADATAKDAASGTCCGTVQEAAASDSCCGTQAKAEAVASGSGCCS